MATVLSVQWSRHHSRLSWISTRDLTISLKNQLTSMDYSKELLQKIEEEARRMMTPAEISALLGIDETELTDDINTLGHPARSAFFMVWP